MKRELPAAWKKALEGDRSGGAWLVGKIALLALVLLILWRMVTFYLAFIRTATAGGLIALLFLSLGVGIALALWMNRNTDAKYPRDLLQQMDRARAGDATSQRLLALRYLHGAPGIHRSNTETIHWLTQSAQGGDGEAAHLLAGMLKAGDGLLPNETEARKWLMRAVEAGHGPAIERLARWDRGESEPLPPPAPQTQDPEPDPPSRLETFLDGLPDWMKSWPLMVMIWVSFLGVSAFLLSAFVALLLFSYSVSPTATLLVGVLFLIALALATIVLFLQRNQNARYAGSSLRLIRRAEAGNPHAQKLLAEAYMEGSRGLTRDAAQASWWLQRCAEGGDKVAAYQLAQWIELGLGHHRDRPLARQWLRRSAEGGYGPAKHLLEHWERKDAAEEKEKSFQG